MQVDNNSLYLALAEKELFHCMQDDKRRQWDLLRSKNCNDFFTADACSILFPRTRCA